MFIYKIYFLLTSILHFLLPSLLNARLKNGKENPERYQEKLGQYKLQRPKGKLVWFHAASVGELNSIIPLIKILKNCTVLVTTVTLNSSKVFEKANLENAIHQFAPLDSPFIIRKFLKHWQPDSGVFIDSEIWPNLLRMASQKIKLINLNARLSERSANKWSWCKYVINYLYSSFDSIYPCSHKDMERIKSLTSHQHIEYIGNLKYAASPLECDKKTLDNLKVKLKGKTIIVAASTHPGEEDFILKAASPILSKHSECLIIIAPRDPKRADEIKKICKQYNINASIRSLDDSISDSQVYIADTLGELGLWYRLSKITIMGGTLLHFGHNMIEPAKLENAIIVGDHYANFTDVVDDFIAHHAIKIIHSPEELETQLTDLIKSPKIVQKLSKNAFDASNSTGMLSKFERIIKKLS